MVTSGVLAFLTKDWIYVTLWQVQTGPSIIALSHNGSVSWDESVASSSKTITFTASARLSSVGDVGVSMLDPVSLNLMYEPSTMVLELPLPMAIVYQLGYPTTKPIECTAPVYYVDGQPLDICEQYFTAKKVITTTRTSVTFATPNTARLTIGAEDG
jgi:hypothetical protein